MPPTNKNKVPRVALAFVLVLALLATNSCKKEAPPEFSSDVMAIVNGEPIRVADFQKAFVEARTGKTDPLPEDSMTALQIKAVFLAELVDKKLLAQQAAAHGISVQEAEIDRRIEELSKDYPEGEFDKILSARGTDRQKLRSEAAQKVLMDKLIDKVVIPSVKVQPSEIEAEYKLHLTRFQEPEKIRASQILVPTESEAESIVTELYGGADFAELAKTRSKAPEAKNGGDLGFFAYNEMPETISQAAFNLAVGQTSGILKSPYGYHIVRVTDRKTQHVVPLNTVSAQLTEEIRRKKAEQALEDYLNKLKESSDIRYNQDLIMKTDLRQAAGR